MRSINLLVGCSLTSAVCLFALPLPGYCGCAHEKGTGQTVGWCLSVLFPFNVCHINYARQFEQYAFERHS